MLCQINEKTDDCPRGIPYDVTTKRLKRIMTGTCYDGTKNKSWLKDGHPYMENLDVYEIGRITNHRTVGGTYPIEYIDETLYGKEKFKTLREKIDWVCSNFANTQKTVESDNNWFERVKEG